MNKKIFSARWQTLSWAVAVVVLGTLLPGSAQARVSLFDLDAKITAEERARLSNDNVLQQQINDTNERLEDPDLGQSKAHAFIGDVIVGDQTARLYALAYGVGVLAPYGAGGGRTSPKPSLTEVQILMSDGPHVPQLSLDAAKGLPLPEVLLSVSVGTSDGLTMSLQNSFVTQVSRVAQVSDRDPRLVRVFLLPQTITLNYNGFTAGYKINPEEIYGSSCLPDNIRFWNTFGTLPPPSPGLKIPASSFDAVVENVFSWAGGAGGGSGKAQFSGVTVTGSLLDQSVCFFFDIVTLRRFFEVRLENWGLSSNSFPESEIRLGQPGSGAVFLTGFSLSTSSTGELVQSLTFAYDTITWIHNEIDVYGKVKTIEHGWNVLKNSLK